MCGQVTTQDEATVLGPALGQRQMVTQQFHREACRCFRAADASRLTSYFLVSIKNEAPAGIRRIRLEHSESVT
jgi:hypothetical protein